MVEAESRPFLPIANVTEASFYNPSIKILQCLGANKNGRPTKVMAQKLLEKGLFLTKEECDRPILSQLPNTSNVRIKKE
ncbi:hypothetical protein ACFXTI_000158 [Malus domestica]